MNPMNLMPFGSEKEEKDASEDKDSSDWPLSKAAREQLPVSVLLSMQDPEEKMQKQLNYIEKDGKSLGVVEVRWCYVKVTDLQTCCLFSLSVLWYLWCTQILQHCVGPKRFESILLSMFTHMISIIFNNILNLSCNLHHLHLKAMTGGSTCRRFAIWIARWQGSWVQLLVVQLAM